MRKIITTLLMSIALVSCSSSDSEDQDLIVGTWKITAATIQNGANGTPEDNTETCTTLDEFTYSANKTVTGLLHSYSSTASNCIANPLISATWANIGNGVYTITFSGSNVPQSSTFTFSNNNNTMLETQVDGDYTLKTTYARQ